LAFGNAVRAQDTHRVAAVQMHAALGEVDANLENAERVRRALAQPACDSGDLAPEGTSRPKSRFTAAPA
jgi:hypothetical protein